MGIVATYISSTSFSVTGDQTTEFVEGRRLKADCGDDGSQQNLITGSSFVTITIVTVSLPNLTMNLVEVQYMGSGGNWIPESWKDVKLILPRLV